MTAPSGREAAVASLQALAQCGREEALYYLAEHNYDVHRAMAARTADVRWELQRGCALPRPAPEQPQIPQETVVQVGPSLQAQLEEARQRLRTRYERETGDTSSSPGALALPLQQPQPTLATAPPAAQPPAAQAAASAPPLVYFPSPAAGAPPQYAAPHLPAQQAQPYTPTTHLPPPAQTSAPSYHYPQQLQQQQPVLYPPPAPTTYAPLQQPGHGWEEASREEANINAGTTRRENPLTLAGQTLGKWIWGGTHHKDKSGSSSSSASSSTPTSASASSSSTTMAPPAPLQSSVSSSAFYPTTSTVPVGEERPGLGMGRRYQSDDSLEINELARDRRSCNGRRAEGTARDEEASTEEGESRGGLRHLLSSVRHRGREIVDRIGHHQATPSGGGGEPQQLTPASEEEELESRRGHRRRSSHSGGGSSAGKRDKRASLDEGWVLVDNTSTRSSTSTHPPQPTLVTQVPLTDEQYAARLSRCEAFTNNLSLNRSSGPLT
ncbi:uncharacterized protein ACA1_171800 [Acanthamoeba castellanii str. Neff]|uniref:UBA domain-containing protein n=1 Tax=Acanthamoeba castellanii (strain ATCC 30010 / Neff) TaxID=1257118 RepID=L8HJQ9_ACACF|nr:uncharacterized protein ACA1_171800 [Acanthamoeba castellanii str. Neff]ELR24596.1 hypothetical protein ACA1_171800 [Acanthamoeba castellanii str. Neff]